MSDLSLISTDEGLELEMSSDGYLVRDGGLETAVLLSLFTDTRVSPSEVPEDGGSQRGWWGDEFLENSGDKIGSKLWLFDRGKVNTEIAQGIKVRAEQSLEWLVDDGVASNVSVVTSVFNLAGSGKGIRLDISIKRPGRTEDKFAMFWDGQELRR